MNRLLMKLFGTSNMEMVNIVRSSLISSCHLLPWLIVPIFRIN